MLDYKNDIRMRIVDDINFESDSDGVFLVLLPQVRRMRNYFEYNCFKGEKAAQVADDCVKFSLSDNRKAPSKPGTTWQVPSWVVYRNSFTRSSNLSQEKVFCMKIRLQAFLTKILRATISTKWKVSRQSTCHLRRKNTRQLYN